MTALRRWSCPLLCALLFFCLALSRSAVKSLEQLPDLYTTFFSGFSLTGNEAQAMAEREKEEQRPAAFTMWKEEKEQSLENPDLNRSASAAVISLSGSSTLLFSSSAPLLPEDTEGCLLDEATAQALFGSPAPVGASLLWRGRALTVRGIVETSRPILLCQAESKEEGLTRLTLRPPEDVPLREALAEFSSRHGLSGGWVSTHTWKSLAGFFSLLFPFLLFLSLFFSLLKTAFSSTEFPIPFFLSLLMAGAVWFFMLWVTGVSFQIPEEFLPNKWSDFDFWGQLWQQKKEELLRFLMAEKTEFDLCLLLPTLQAFVFGALSVLLFPLFLTCYSKEHSDKTAATLEKAAVRETGPTLRLWLWCAFSLLLSFLASISLHSALAKDRLLWLCFPVYFILSYLSKTLIHTVTQWRTET